jgi:hypothetical protein
MRGKSIRLSRPRRFLVDLLHFTAHIPSVPVQRRMQLAEVAAARKSLAVRPSWPALFIKAYSQVADEFPALRRAYVGIPWPHLREYSKNVASVAIERQYENEPCVFFARINNPAKKTLAELHTRIRHFADTPIESITTFRRMLAFARWPRPVRRTLFWLGLNVPSMRPGLFGTFGLSVYSSLGAESLHPLSPLTVTLNYGVIEPDGSVSVRLVYDHRVFDGATAARALARLETAMTGSILDELRGMASASKMAA